MAQLQEIFDRIKETKAEQKILKEGYKNALENHTSYKNVIEDLDKLKQKKKDIEEDIKLEMKSDFEKLDRIKLDLADDKMMLSDIAINVLMSGKTVEVNDEYGNRYEPEFSVKFKKAG